MVLTETKEEKTVPTLQLDLQAEEEPLTKFELSESTIFIVMLAGALISLVWFFFIA